MSTQVDTTSPRIPAFEAYAITGSSSTGHSTGPGGSFERAQLDGGSLFTKIFTALAEGGQLKGQLTKQPWGGETGYLMDKFGINWVVTIEAA